MAFRTTKNRRRSNQAARAARMRSLMLTVVSGFLKLVLVLLVGGGLYFGGTYAWTWLTTAPQFALETVRFAGVERARPGDLLTLAGLSTGQNLVKLSPSAIEKSLKAHPWVETVEVTRHFPRSVSVKITEHEPKAFVSLGDLYLLNREGKPFRQLQPDDALDLPLVSGIKREVFLSDPEAAVARFRVGLEVAAAYEHSPASEGAPLSEIRLDEEGTTLVVGEGEELVLGQGDLEQKLERLSRIRTELASRGLNASRIRLDNRSRPGWVSVQLAELKQ